jgi:autotransporter family porin
MDVSAIGSVGARSDQAVLAEGALGGTATLSNAGEVLGMVTMTDLADSFTNGASGSWNLRHFADQDGDGVRDTEAVAISDFGAETDVYTNAAGAVLRLLTVEDMVSFTASTDDDTAPLAVDTTGEYLPLGGESPDQPGVEQGQLLNLETFDHGGVVTLADAETGGTSPIYGDVLVITGAASAGMDGGGRYVANGGTLRIDTVLNAGGANSQSDVLVVDNVEIGTGPTEIVVSNALTGGGASTDTNGNGTFDLGEGILVVEVLGSTSPQDAFVMTPVSDSGVTYALAQGEDGNWYLQTSEVPPSGGPGVAPIPALNRVGLALLVLLMLAAAVTVLPGRRASRGGC